jgi:hypothetical protein
VTIYLTAEQILFIHYRLVSETGGEHGLRDLGLLESAVARPRQTFGNAELYPDIFEKAAALMEISGPESPAQYYFYGRMVLPFRQRIQNWKSLHFVLHHQRSNDLK